MVEGPDGALYALTNNTDGRGSPRDGDDRILRIVPARRLMEGLLDSIADAYRQGIEAPGKETHFLILLAFIASFGFIRTSAHMIRAQVSWWPGNVQTKSGTHVHHLVWGILALLVFGYVGLAFEPGSPGASSSRSSSGSGWA